MLNFIFRILLLFKYKCFPHMFVPLYIVYCPIFKCFLFLTSKENYTFCILLLLYYFSRTFLRHLNVVATKCYSFTFSCVLQVMYNIYHIKYSKDRLQNILLPYFLYLFMLVVLEKLLEIFSYISECSCTGVFLGFIARCGISTSCIHIFLY